MSNTKTMLTLLGLLVGLIYIPFSFYLTYQILLKIGGSDLMWFLFWILLPIAFLSSIISKIIENIDD